VKDYETDRSTRQSAKLTLNWVKKHQTVWTSDTSIIQTNFEIKCKIQYWKTEKQRENNLFRIGRVIIDKLVYFLHFQNGDSMFAVWASKISLARLRVEIQVSEGANCISLHARTFGWAAFVSYDATRQQYNIPVSSPINPNISNALLLR